MNKHLRIAALAALTCTSFAAHAVNFTGCTTLAQVQAKIKTELSTLTESKQFDSLKPEVAAQAKQLGLNISGQVVDPNFKAQRKAGKTQEYIAAAANIDIYEATIKAIDAAKEAFIKKAADDKIAAEKQAEADKKAAQLKASIKRATTPNITKTKGWTGTTRKSITKPDTENLTNDLETAHTDLANAFETIAKMTKAERAELAKDFAVELFEPNSKIPTAFATVYSLPVAKDGKDAIITSIPAYIQWYLYEADEKVTVNVDTLKLLVTLAQKLDASYAKDLTEEDYATFETLRKALRIMTKNKADDGFVRSTTITIQNQKTAAGKAKTMSAKLADKSSVVFAQLKADVEEVAGAINAK